MVLVCSLCACACEIYIYIYIYRERERVLHFSDCVNRDTTNAAQGVACAAASYSPREKERAF